MRLLMDTRMMRLPDRYHIFDACRLSCLLVAVCVLATGCRQSSSGTPVDQSGASQIRQIVALGRLEPATGIISISAIPGQRLQSLNDGVEEGATFEVPATKASRGAATSSATDSDGDDASKQHDDPYILGYLASYDLRKAQLDVLGTKKSLSIQKQSSQLRLAEVQLRQAEAACLQAKAKKAEIEARQPRLNNLQRAAELAHQDFLEMKRLQANDPELITQNQLDRHENQSERAQIEYDVLDESFQPALDAAEAANLAAMKNKEVAEENLKQLKTIDTFEIEAIDKEIELAKKTLAQSELRLPEMGGKAANYTVLKIFMRPGEFVTQIPILQVGDLTKMVCIAEVYEADAKEVAVGQTVRIFSSAFIDKYARKSESGNLADQGGIQGTVKRVGSIITSPGLSNRNPLAPSDRSVIEVLIEIDSQATTEAAKRVGLQVTVEFDAKPEKTANREMPTPIADSR